MIITRFAFNFSFGDFLYSFFSLFRSRRSLPETILNFFPDSQVFAVRQARIGLRYALEAFQLKNNANIGVQPYTCSSVLAAIHKAGHQPFFIDINQDLLIDLEDLIRKIDRIDALILTHTFGKIADISTIKGIASNIPMIEDCSHAMFSTFQNRQVGQFFDASIFSFGYGKFPALGSGGLLVINNPKYQEFINDKIKRLPKRAFGAELFNISKHLFFVFYYSKMGSFLSSWLIKKKSIEQTNKNIIKYPKTETMVLKSTLSLLFRTFGNYKSRNLKQISNAAYLQKFLPTLFQKQNYLEVSPNYFTVPILTSNRDQLVDFLNTNNIAAAKHFQYSIDWSEKYGYQKGDCPNFEKILPKIVTIPCHYQLTQTQLDYFIQIMKDYERQIA